ncbi:PAB-dependent poly(A)-specific ribonuclease subunit 3, partial [Rhizopus azygosporus]
VSSTSTKRLCRNVIIHGYCKFENKGCEFNHDTNKSIVLPQQQNATSPENRYIAEHVHAPVFIPSSLSSATQDPTANTNNNTSIRNPAYRYSAPPSNSSSSNNNNQFNQFGIHVPDFVPQQQSKYNPLLSNGHIDPYFYPPSFHHQSLNQYHKVPALLPHVANLLPHQRVAQSFLIPDNLNEQLIKRQEAAIQTKSGKESGLPDEVHVYHSLYPLEEKAGKFFGHPSWLYKAICRTNGKPYVMVRIEGFRLVNEHAMTMVKEWKKIKHANIISIKEAFTTRAFGDSSLIFIYDYHPCSITLFEAYFTPQAQALLHARLQATGGTALPVPETTLWSFITQIASALKTIHAAGLSARTIDVGKVIMTSKNRLRLSCCGILDVLQYETASQKAPYYQQEDLLTFESNLGFELENSRLVRLLSKFGFINERP